MSIKYYFYLETLKKIRNFKLCPHCNQILKKPFLLPCGHTVCKMHVRTYNFLKPIICKICGKSHEGYYKSINNVFVRDLLKKVDTVCLSSMRLFLLFLNENEYNSYYSKDSKIDLEKIKSICFDLKEDPFTIVYNEINEIMNYVQLQKVNKLEISVENQTEEKNSTEKEEKFIEELTAYRNECREHLNTLEFKEKRDKLINEVEPQIKTCLKFLDLFKSTDDTPSINVANNKYVEVINSKIETFLINELFLNKMSYYKDKMIELSKLNLNEINSN
jgi:hypothetical protein